MKRCWLSSTQPLLHLLHSTRNFSKVHHSSHGNTHSSLTPMMKQFQECKMKHPGYILLFQVGDFYESFYEDAKKASQLLGLALTKKGDSVPMCGIPCHALKTYLQRLVMQHGMSVAICNQMETPDEAKQLRGKKALIRREVVRLVTPGTLTEDSFLTPGQNNYLAALYFYNNKDHHDNEDNLEIGLAWTDVSTGEFHSTLSSKRKILGDLARCNPRELLLPSLNQSTATATTATASSILDLLAENSALLSRCTITHLPSNEFYDFQMNKETGLTYSENAAAAALLSYIRYTQKETTSGHPIASPERYINKEKMIIDASAWRSLEISQTLDGTTKGSLLHSIDRTVTAGGSRLLVKHLASPLLNPEAIQQRLEAVDYFILHPFKAKEIRTILRNCRDIERCLQRVVMQHCSPRDLKDIELTLGNLMAIRDFLEESNAFHGEMARCFAALKKCELNPLIAFLDSAIIEETNLYTLSKGRGFIRSGFSTELDKWRNIQLSDGFPVEHNLLLKSKLELQDEYRKSTEIKELIIKEIPKWGYVAEIPSSYELSHIPEFLFRNSTVKSKRYKTPSLYLADENLRYANRRVEEIEMDVFKQLQKKILEAHSLLKEAAATVALLDVYCSHARIAMERNFCRPELDDSLDLCVDNGRHTIVETAHAKGLNGVNRIPRSFVPNSLQISSSSSSQDMGTFWLLTGANMGGKSTFLRQSAHIVILAQIGSYVPATKVKMGVIDRLFSRVGALDDLAGDRSTFMVEMQETAAIINEATSRSLVLMDEVGRGTSTMDGVAIATAVMEDLCQRRIRTIFATHYHELAVYEHDNLRTVCMEVVDSSNESHPIFGHRLLPGVATTSHGLHVAAIAGVPSRLLTRANAIQLEMTHCSGKKLLKIIENCDPSRLSAEEALKFLRQLKKIQVDSHSFTS